MIAVRCRRYRS